jgi:Alpha/beta hydrolase domain
MTSLKVAIAVFGGTLVCAHASQAAVVKLEVTSRTVLATHSLESPRHEVISGRYAGELDPADPHNSIITDLNLAPRNARGKVEYSADFVLTRPWDPEKVSGVLIYDVANRGGAPVVADEKGHIHVVSGWQGDIPPAPDKYTLTVPVARNPDGSPVTGPVFARFINMPKDSLSLSIRGGIGAGVPLPEPVSMVGSDARLIRRRSDAKTGEAVPAEDWAFADCSQTPFPGAPNPKMLCVKEGFDPAFAYELTYTGKDPPVLGIGFAAVRDLVAFLRYSPGTQDAPNPIAGQVRKTIGRGPSQSGNFIRSFIHLGFNAAEDGRIVFDGVNPHIAARLLAMNLRFSVPSGAAEIFEPGSEGVLWWGRYEDKLRGHGVSSLLDRCSADHTCPKVFETFGSSEFWGLRMSPDLVGPDAKADIPLPANVRRYYFPGTTHGGGAGGFSTRPQDLPHSRGCELAGNPNPMFPSMRALTQALVEWVVDGKEPPPSRYPQLSTGDLVPPKRTAMGFPVIPGKPSPEGKLNPLPIYDFGPEFRSADLSGRMTLIPPKIRGQTAALVPRVDADGNETSGIPSVQLRVPLGTYLGWNVQATGYYKGAACGFQGGFIPFAQTREERLASKDPRPSLEERYGTHAGFVEKVKAAAADLVRERFLLPEDAQQIVKEAETSDVLVGGVADE